MTDLATLRDDLLAEQSALDDIVVHLAPEQWALPTSSAGWDVADQIGHLSYFDGAAATAITDPDAFRASAEALLGAASPEDVGGNGSRGPRRNRLADELTLGAFRSLSSDRQLEAWRSNRRILADAAAELTDADRVGWYGPSMGAKSFLTARLMEVWAHGHDVGEAVGARVAPSDRLRHIAQLGYLTREWSYRVRSEVPPPGQIRLELTCLGQSWTWGTKDAVDTVRGPAEEFCLVVTQRRHLDDTALRTGELGRHWLLRAQAFAGGPSDGPAPRR